MLKSLPTTNYKLQTKTGFTVVELLVATSVFLMLLSVAIITFIQALRTQRVVTELAAANNNTTLALEKMIREIRTGDVFTEPVTSSPSSLLRFVNYKGEKVSYQLIGNSIGHCAIGACLLDSEFTRITAPEVKVKRLVFIVSGQDPLDTLATRVTVVLSVLGPKDIEVNLQSTISPRLAE